MSDDRSNYNDYGLVFDYDKTIVDICGGNLTHYQNIIQSLLNKVCFKPESIVLELACGTGIGSEILLQNNFAKLYCLDKSNAMLNETECRLSNYDRHWRYVSDRFQFDKEINGRGDNTYLQYYPMITIPRVTLLKHDAYDVDNLQMLGLGSQAVDVIVMANTWNSLVTPPRLAKAVWNRLDSNGLFVFNTKVQHKSLISLQQIVTQNFYDPNFSETRFSCDNTDVPPTSTVEEVRSILESNGFSVSCHEQDLFLSQSEAIVYLQAAAQRFVRNYREKEGEHNTRVENLFSQLKATINDISERQNIFFWRREAFFEVKKQ